MRPIVSEDRRRAVRWLASLDAVARPAAARWLIERAHAADRYRRRTGRAHPLWGRGTLADAVPAGVGALPRPGEVARLAAEIALIEALLAWRQDPDRRSRPSERPGLTVPRRIV